jgi:hypothetical protein
MILGRSTVLRWEIKLDHSVYCRADTSFGSRSAPPRSDHGAGERPISPAGAETQIGSAVGMRHRGLETCERGVC